MVYNDTGQWKAQADQLTRQLWVKDVGKACIRRIGLPVTNATPEILVHLTSILSLHKHL